MKFLKGLALSLLGFLLLLSLSIFATAFTLNSTILNPDFVVSQIDKLDISSVAEEVITMGTPQGELPEELGIDLIDTITKFEPVVKEQVIATIYPVYDYLLGKSQSPDLAVTLGNTFLNSNFVVSLMDELDLALVTEMILSQQIDEEAFPEEFKTALVSTITEHEPLIKQRIGAATAPIFDYLLEKRQSIDLALTLRNTILTSDFVASLVDGLDISSLVKEFLSEQVIGEIPEELGYLEEYLDDVIAELEPTIKEELITAADPILDYLLGESRSLSVVISLEPVMGSIEDTLRGAFLESPPPELATLPPAALELVFDTFYPAFSKQIPPTFELNESLIGTEMPAQIAEALAGAEETLEQGRQGIAEALAEAEGALAQAKQYVGYFQLGYKLLIGFILLLILGIIFINRQIKGATRSLGSIFLTFAIPACLSIAAVKYFDVIQAWILRLLNIDIDIPAQLQALVLQAVNDFVAPIWMLSLGLLIAGVVLLIVSSVYKPRQPSV